MSIRKDVALDNKIDIKKLDASIFWEIRFEHLDPVVNCNFIVARVLQRGSDDEVFYIMSLFSYSEIHQIICDRRDVTYKLINHFKTLRDAEHRRRFEKAV